MPPVHTPINYPAIPAAAKLPCTKSGARARPPALVLLVLLVLLTGTGSAVPVRAAVTTAAAVSRIAAAVPGAGYWQWPLQPRPVVLRRFDPPAQRWLSGHRGVDLAARSGQQVRAPTAGIVSFAGTVVDRSVITIAHGHNLRSSFEAVESSLHRGDAVTSGQVIGRLSASAHCGSRSCLHWGVRRMDIYQDPLAFVMDLRPSVLLPVPAQ